MINEFRVDHNKTIFTSNQLLLEVIKLTAQSVKTEDALLIGEIASLIGKERELPIAVEVRFEDWIIYHASLPGSTVENQG